MCRLTPLTQNPWWSLAYSKQGEILSYLKQAANKFGVTPHIRFGQEVASSTWDPVTSKWTVETVAGERFTGDVLVSGLGALHVPRLPDLPGLEEFGGESFHTSAWPKDFQARGRRVAVVGTGASAVQAVPGLAAMLPTSLTVFQRTPCWSPPRGNFPMPGWMKTMFALVPVTNTLYRWLLFWRAEWRYRVLFTTSWWVTRRLAEEAHTKVRTYIRAAVKDQELAVRLTPTYEMGCRRITPSDHYLNTFNMDNVHLNTSRIEAVTKSGIRTADGMETEMDAIIYATGFDLEKSAKPYKQVGLAGTLADDYGDAPSAYLGITHPNHPNFFTLLGPGTILGHNSVIFMIECQVNYIAEGIASMVRSGSGALVVKREVLEDYANFLKEGMEGKVFGRSGGCGGWYANSRGVNWTLWPGDLVSYWWRTRGFRRDQYRRPGGQEVHKD